MSMRTRFGSRASTNSTAASPVSASPTTSKPGVMVTTALAALRKGAWSSAIRTLTMDFSIASSFQSRNRLPTVEAPVADVVLALRPQVEQNRLHALVNVLLVGEVELREDRVDVLLDRALRQHQGVRDRGVVLALRHLAEHLPLARRQLGERRPAAARTRGDKRLHDLRVDDGAAARDLDDRAGQLLEVLHPLLQQVCAPGRALLEEVD